MIKNVNITALWTYVIIDLNGEEIAGTFYELQKKNDQKEFTIEKAIKRKLYVKQKGHEKGYDKFV